MDAALSALTERAQPPPPEPVLIKPQDVARRLGVHVSTIYRWLDAGSFPTRAFRIGKQWRIDARALDQWLEAQ